MSSEESDASVRTACLLVLAAISIGVALFWLRPVMVPFVLAVFLAFILNPLVGLLIDRIRMPRGAAVLATLLILLLAFVVIGGVVANSLSELSANSGDYEARLETLLAQAAEIVPLKKLGLDGEGLREVLAELPRGRIRDLLMSMTGAILGLLSQGLVVLIFVTFLLLGTPTPSADQSGVWQQINGQVVSYIVTKVVLSSVTGILVALILGILGIDFAVGFGFLAFALNFIPNVGSVIATVLPIPIILLTPDITGMHMLLAIALPGIVQFVVGNVVEPKVMGDSLQLHPVTILVALMFWGMLWGIVGMLLAAPITATLRIILARIDATRPFADLMAGSGRLLGKPEDESVVA